MTPRHLACALALSLVLLGCERASGPTDSEGPTVEAVAGLYGADGGIASLELAPDGSFECLVLNGMVDGCGTVEGAGVSKGRWSLRGETIAFEPANEPDLVISLVGATAVVDEAGIDLSTGGRRYVLARQVREY